MRTLVSGKGVEVGGSDEVSNTNGTTFMSKGSAVKSPNALTSSPDSAAETFCRTWTNFDRYNQVINLQKNRGLDRRNDGNLHHSVLDDNGFVKIAPYKSDTGDDISKNPKRYMFSIENLAWHGYASAIPECEQGPGDALTGAHGRIMWFPPYEMSFTDNSTVQWEANNFIGRGEPLYTYNNTERKGTLQWKIIIDHNTYQNQMLKEGRSKDYMISFNAGCIPQESELSFFLTDDEKNSFETKTVQKPKTVNKDEVKVPEPFNLYYPNDSASIPTTYEDGVVVKDEETDGEGIVAKYRTKAAYGQPYLGPYKNPNDFSLNIQPWDDLNGNIYTTPVDKIFGLAQYLFDNCKSCKVRITGSVSVQVDEFKSNAQDLDEKAKKEENRKNQKILAAERAYRVKRDLIQQLELLGEKTPNKRFKTCNSESESCSKPQTTEGGFQIISVEELQVTTQEGQEAEDYKKQRNVQVEIIPEPEKSEEIEQEAPETVVSETDTKALNEAIVARMYTECDYFEKLKQDSKFVYESIEESMKYFHPAFHSITPEGFNSRLTFLKQCTRQGPTKNPNGNPDNLAFGRPPVCILRVGDFYHSKIAIDNVSFSFDPLVWDLNPEGIGVQPMICTVDMTFSFIGGSSLAGPINRLQNALSFNYFANTEVYDSRADKIKVNRGSKGQREGELIRGSLDKVEYEADELKSGKNTVKDSTDNGARTSEKDDEATLEKEEVKQGGDENEAISEDLQAQIDEIENSKLSINSNTSDNIDLRVIMQSTGLLLNEGWSYTVNVYNNNGGWSELKSGSIDDGGVVIGDQIVFTDIVNYSDIENYRFTEKPTLTTDFQSALNRYFEEGIIDKDKIFNCLSNVRATVEVPLIAFKIDFKKEGVETISKYGDTYLATANKYQVNFSGGSFDVFYREEEVKPTKDKFPNSDIKLIEKRNNTIFYEDGALKSYINSFGLSFCS
jgi:hypothetical protein